MLTLKQQVEYQRRCNVDLMGDDPDVACTVHILCSALAELGQYVRVDKMVAHANWLVEASLVEIVHRDSPMVVRMTRRGHHVAVGDINERGVERPLR